MLCAAEEIVLQYCLFCFFFFLEVMKSVWQVEERSIFIQFIRQQSTQSQTSLIFHERIKMYPWRIKGVREHAGFMLK